MEQIKIKKKKKKKKKLIELVKQYYLEHVKVETKNYFEYLMEHEADINKENNDGETELFYGCRSGNKDLVENLVEHGADINKVYSNRKTAFYF